MHSRAVGRWDVEREHGEVNVAGRVVLLSEQIPEFSFSDPARLALAVWMRGDVLGNALEYGGEIPVSAEEDESRFRIPPCGVARELVYGAIQRRRARPEFAFADECVRSLLADENVGLACAVEGLTGGSSLEMAVERNKDVVADVLFGEPGEGDRIAFDADSQAGDQFQDEVVVLFGDRRLRLECFARRCGNARGWSRSSGNGNGEAAARVVAALERYPELAE